MEVGYIADDETRAAIARMGRTEDVQFSPDGSHLAVAAFNENRLVVMRVEADWTAEPPKVALSSPLEIASDALRQPHGLSWIDSRTIAVASRMSCLAVFQLPELPASGRIKLSPVRTLGDQATDLVTTPGSVSAAAIGLDLIELLVCNNYVHHISRHLLDRRSGFEAVASEILTHGGLAVPDGVTHSPNGRWVAISNHGHHNVLLFRNDRELGPTSDPDAILSGINYPHGVRFVEHGKAMLVADAGAPFVYLYRSDGDWTGERQPDVSIRVLSDETFDRGRVDPSQGGPKGVDVTPDGTLMVISCEEEPFAFFDVRGLLDQGSGETPSLANDGESVRDALLRYSAFNREKVEQATAAIRRATDLELLRMTESRSWKITGPLRKAMAAFKGAVPYERP